MIRLSCLLLVSLWWNIATLPAQGQIIVAHRGASHDAPENTLAAFRLAWEQQADGIEGDFYLTSDKQIVCIHDADTKRTAGVVRKVAETTLEELRQLDYGRWKGERWTGEPIPTFAEVLRAVPRDKQFFIELKTGPEIVPILKQELKQHPHIPAHLTIIAFQPATIRACKEQLPHIKAHWLTGFKRDEQSKAWRPSAAEIGRRVRELKADGAGLYGNREVIDEAFVDQLRAAGCPEFHVWTIDQPQDALSFQRLGAYGITTNRPAFIRDALQQR